jgi:predicted SpoU family rRNA methylase
MRICVKSYPEYFEKEKDGRKPFTARVLDGKDIIEITNTETDEKIERNITDITSYFNGQIFISFSKRFKNETA